MKQSEFWDKRATKYHEGIQKHDALFVDTINRTISLLKDSDIVLDFGCGSGEFSFELFSRVKHITGIDVSSSMIKLATAALKSKNVSNAEFHNIDILNNRFESETYSTVLAFNIFHVLDDIEQSMAELYRILKPGGTLISQTPCLGERGWFFKSFIKIAQMAGIAPPILSLTTKDLESFINKYPFTIVENRLVEESTKTLWIVAIKQYHEN